ncbi:hypothetical protein BpHYR1_005499 [Brachionus plicatilis]|uniref:Uncharacterized protein n=1 Tax=Brachionus plicatilis TaxID=10195 RepID=A0A3M7PAM7_BRAPC|nr:hypothetical protein BpHYR1_005499 [Brachionus plicatilis]
MVQMNPINLFDARESMDRLRILHERLRMAHPHWQIERSFEQKFGYLNDDFKFVLKVFKF